MAYNLLLKTYEGPLDLLYDLITKNKIDIYEISIFEISDQYMRHINAMEKMDLDVASEFIIMACKLLEIKSKYLLYKKNEEDLEQDPRKELIDRLIIYKTFKNASMYLREKLIIYEEGYYRKREEFVYEDKIDLSILNMNMLTQYFPILLREIEREPKENFKRVYKRERISLEQRLDYVRFEINKRSKLLFEELINEGSKEEIIVTFLSMLELIKCNEVEISQDGFLSQIVIKKVN